MKHILPALGAAVVAFSAHAAHAQMTVIDPFTPEPVQGEAVITSAVPPTVELDTLSQPSQSGIPKSLIKALVFNPMKPLQIYREARANAEREAFQREMMQFMRQPVRTPEEQEIDRQIMIQSAVAEAEALRNPGLIKGEQPIVDIAPTTPAAPKP